MSADLKNYYLPALREKEAGAVLDFGSGHGRVISFLLSEGFRDVRGFERNEALRSEIPAELLDRTTFGNDWSAFFRDSGKKWDAVILKDVLYYFDDHEAEDFLRALRSRLTETGMLAVEVFNGATLTGPYVMFKDRGIRRIFTEQSLVSLLVAAGFSVSAPQGMVPVIQGPGSMVFYIFSRIWKCKLHLIYWLERGWDAQNPSILEKKIFVVARTGARDA